MVRGFNLISLRVMLYIFLILNSAGYKYFMHFIPLYVCGFVRDGGGGGVRLCFFKIHSFHFFVLRFFFFFWDRILKKKA